MKKQKRILWAEDRKGTRYEIKKTLSSYLGKQGIQYRLDLAKSGKELFSKVKKNAGEYDLIVLDLEMGPFTGRDVIPLLSSKFPHIPIIVVSAYTKKYAPILHQFLDENKIVGDYDFESADEWLAVISKLLTKKDIVLLHLSDIHFGKYHAFPRRQDLSKLLDSALDDLGTIVGRQPNLVIISGDLTSEANDDDFDSSIQFIKHLSDKLRLGLDRFVIVPGNHDLARYEVNIGRRFDKYIEFLNNIATEVKGGKEFLSRYPKLYDAKQGRLMTPRGSLQRDGLYTIAEFHEHEIVIIGLNSVIPEKEQQEYGEISHAQLIDAMSASEKLEQSYLRVAVFHHHLFPVPMLISAQQQTGSEKNRVLLNQGIVLKELTRKNFQFVVHGHSHYPAGYKYQLFPFGPTGNVNVDMFNPIYVFATGTLSGKKVNQAKSYFSFNSMKMFGISDNTMRQVSVTGHMLPLDSLTWDRINLRPFSLIEERYTDSENER